MKFKKTAAVILAATLSAGFMLIPAADIDPIAVTASAVGRRKGAPSGFKAYAEKGIITFSWRKVNGADAYGIYLYDETTEKYNLIKTVETTTAVISDLDRGRSYKFKVAALVKKGDGYAEGKLSKEIKVTLSVKAGDFLAPCTMTVGKMVGTWVFYDFTGKVSYDKAEKYNPAQKEYEYDYSYLNRLTFIDKENVYLTYNEDETGNSATGSVIYNLNGNSVQSKEYPYTKFKFKTYIRNNDYYLFLEWYEKYTYVFKYAPAPAADNITNRKNAEGTWKTVDFCKYSISQSDKYNPDYPVWGWDMNVRKMVVSGKHAKIMSEKGTLDSAAYVTNSKIGDNTYKICVINNKEYLFMEWKSDNGENQFYVFEKE